MTACGRFQHLIQVSLSCVCAADEINPVKLIQEFKLLIWLASFSMKSISRPRFGINSWISWSSWIYSGWFSTQKCKSKQLKNPTLLTIPASFLFLTLFFLLIFFRLNWKHTVGYEKTTTTKKKMVVNTLASVIKKIPGNLKSAQLSCLCLFRVKVISSLTQKMFHFMENVHRTWGINFKKLRIIFMILASVSTRPQMWRPKAHSEGFILTCTQRQKCTVCVSSRLLFSPLGFCFSI